MDFYSQCYDNFRKVDCFPTLLLQKYRFFAAQNSEKNQLLDACFNNFFLNCKLVEVM